ncbi:unnamed protein product [Leuciscus chuanchicus]
MSIAQSRSLLLVLLLVALSLPPPPLPKRPIFPHTSSSDFHPDITPTPTLSVRKEFLMDSAGTLGPANHQVEDLACGAFGSSCLLKMSVHLRPKPNPDHFTFGLLYPDPKRQCLDALIW